MSKQKVFTLLSVVGVIALIVFLIIVFSTTADRTLSQTIVAAICFFIFLMVGIPSIILKSDPNAISWTKHIESKK